MGTTMQGFYVNLPSTEVEFFKELVRKMGWTVGQSRSVEKVSVAQKKQTKDVSEDIRSIIGLASTISEEDVAKDDRLAYLLSK